MAKQKNTSKPTHYVGIGASAGGLEAIESFFSNMPVDTGLAFIVVQHLSPDYKSLMVELLSKRTQIPVHRAENGAIVKKNAIYLIPPKKNLTIFHGKLILSEQDHSRGINLPIDLFLKSLAEDQGAHSIAVILSGTGSDGTRGIRSVKEAGGMIMIQDDETARFDGMPRSAISTGMADFILSPDEMPEFLLNYVKHPFVAKPERRPSIITDEDSFDRIFSLIRARTKLDFTYYKPSTVLRRIERRISINQVDSLREYVDFLEKNSAEIIALYRELLIGVTNFFRDKEAFDDLASRWLPQILKNSQNREIRFWVAGCSGGEEAYSLAILTKECIDSLGMKNPVKIFATDVDRDAILEAGNGLFSEGIVADLTPDQISKYFLRRDNTFEISREIRKMVVFAQHNLIKDPPFTNIELVSCRNLLIYLQPVLQGKVLEMFNFSLNPGGILFLGSSETTGDMSEYFESINHKWKIYRAKGTKKPIDKTHEVPVPVSFQRRLGTTHDNYKYRQREDRLLNRILDSLAGEYVTLMIIVNDQMELQYVLGDTNGFFKVPSGKTQNDISKMAVKELYIPLTTGIQKVFNSNQEILYSNIKLQIGNTKKTVKLRIKPLPEKHAQEQLVAVFFEIVKKKRGAPKKEAPLEFNVGRETEQRINDLEAELQFSRENLQATIEELETSNEELQATNEELLSSNEELQSTNEELQSVNEELHTVNAEHQNKIIELTELNNDINNLFESTDIGTLFLDENLDIRKFTPRAADIFKIVEQDIGRPVDHLSHYLTDVDPFALINDVHIDHNPVEKEVITEDGRWYLVRILPYKIDNNVYSGIILTITDINTIKAAEKKLSESESSYKRLFDTMSQGVIYQDRDGRILSANPAAERILGLTYNQMIGRDSNDPRWKTVHEDGNDYPGETHPSMIAVKTGKEINNEIMGVYHPKEDRHRWINIHAVPLFKLNAKKPYCVYTTFENITERIESNKKLKDANERLNNAMKAGRLAWWEMEYPSGKVSFSAEKVLMLGYDPKNFEDAHYTDFTDLIHPEDIDKTMSAMSDLLNGTSTVYHAIYRIKTNDDEYKWFEDTGTTTEYDSDGNPRMISGVVRDISILKKSADALELSEELYRQLFVQMYRGVALHKVILDKKNNPVDYEYVDINEAFEKIIGLKRKDVIGKKVSEVFPDIKQSKTDWIGIYGNVALTGKSKRFERKFEVLNKTFNIIAFSPKKEYFVTLFEESGE